MSYLPPAEKLPLAVRKNVRDAWDQKKESLEKDLSEVCEVAWTVDIDPLAIYPYAESGSYAEKSLGSALKQYVSGAIYELKRFKYNNGSAGIADMNTICYARVLTLDAEVTGRLEYNGVDVIDGRLRLLFNPQKINNNIDDCLGSTKLEDALNQAPLPEAWGSPLSFKAKSGIQTAYNKKIDKIKSDIGSILQSDNTKLTPNFEENFVKLKEAKEKGIELVYDDWEKYLGPFTSGYFAAVGSSLRHQGFAGDEMLREGFAEAVPTGEIVFQIVDELKNDDVSSESVIKDGVFYLQTTPQKWGRNIDSAAAKLIDLL
ncbi:hypothetical protein B0I35DRAFT_462573 [Stachybotrys elegans]|uniref:Uncharacterized protein n=1 Tax=Stachybotrys elegans TaxID=80388 RepID=A0A8K0SHY3_9HYPO|nr:hypothetical protein B0I35DRAFT_462573 [Stachybotrys elegans]